MKKDFVEILYEKRKIIIIIVAILIIAIPSAIFISNKLKPKETIQEVTTTLKIFGDGVMSLEVGDTYDEPGYYAIDSNGVIKTDQVEVTSNLDTSKPGTYIITYQVDEEILTRTIEVTGEVEEEKPPEETKPLEITLNGEKVITLTVGEEYQEPGFTALAPNGENINSMVLTTGAVDTRNPGEYTLTYIVEYNGERKEAMRTVVVIDDTLTITTTANTTDFTNSHVTINIKVDGNTFKTLVFPNNVVSDSKESTYDITSNGTYTFTAYNVNGKAFTKSIEVTNIDTEKPSGTCEATINKDNTAIIVSATDNISGIKNYDYLDNETKIVNLESDNFTYDQKTSKNVHVMVYDKAGNSNDIVCNVIDKSYYEPIKPGETENIVKQGETETLKVYITKKSSYYITRIWAYDPYRQLNKFDSPEYGKNLYKPKKLLNTAKEKYNLSNQLLVGFNASGFYLKGTYDASSVSKYGKYNKTSVGTLVITNGEVIRNAYDRAYKTWYTIGIDKTNTLKIFTDKKASTKAQKEEKKTWAEEVIASGIRNTFTFASPLIEDGKKSSKKTSMPSASSKLNRQAICQINDNNFALITGKNLNRTKLQNIMLDLKCQTGTNLDGGGSIALLFQPSGSNTVSTIIGNGRALTEVGYFSELN